MGLTAILETENGVPLRKVFDPPGLLHRLLPVYDDESFHLLRFVDPYGSTVFNRLQMERFLLEWQRIADKAQTPEEHDLVYRIERLAWRCRNEVHLYLRFDGD